MKRAYDPVGTYRKFLLYVLTAFFLIVSGYGDLLDAAGRTRSISLELLLARPSDVLVFACALLMLLSAPMTLRWPRQAAVVALIASMATFPYFLIVLFYSFFAALFFIFILPGAYFLIWIPWAMVWTAGFVSLMTLFSTATRQPQTSERSLPPNLNGFGSTKRLR